MTDFFRVNHSWPDHRHECVFNSVKTQRITVLSVISCDQTSSNTISFTSQLFPLRCIALEKFRVNWNKRTHIRRCRIDGIVAHTRISNWKGDFYDIHRQDAHSSFQQIDQHVRLLGWLLEPICSPKNLLQTLREVCVRPAVLAIPISLQERWDFRAKIHDQLHHYLFKRQQSVAEDVRRGPLYIHVLEVECCRWSSRNDERWVLTLAGPAYFKETLQILTL